MGDGDVGREDQEGYVDLKRWVLSFDLNWVMESVLRLSGGSAFQSRRAVRLTAADGEKCIAHYFSYGTWSIGLVFKVMFFWLL